MSEARIPVFPKEPKPEAIRLCDDCNVGDINQERFFSPYGTFLMGIDQLTAKREDKVGIAAVSVNLVSKRDITLTDFRTGEEVTQKDVVAPIICDDMRSVGHLLPEDWERLKEDGCPGPELGHKRYFLFGPRKKSCGLLKIMQLDSLKISFDN